MKTQEHTQVQFTNDETWHRQILYVTKNFRLPVNSTFCGAKGKARGYKQTQKPCTCPDCAKMTLEDAIAKVEERIRNRELLV